MKAQTKEDNVFAHKCRRKTWTFKQNMLEIAINKDLIIVHKEVDVGEKLTLVVMTHDRGVPKYLTKILVII